MTIKADIDDLANLCGTGAKQTLNALLSMGPRPIQPAAAAAHWDQVATRLQGQLNSLTAMVSKLGATGIIEGLQGLDVEIAKVGQVSKSAEARIQAVKDASSLLTKLAKVLDLGLAILAVAAAPSPPTIAALASAAVAVAQSV